MRNRFLLRADARRTWMFRVPVIVKGWLCNNKYENELGYSAFLFPFNLLFLKQHDISITHIRPSNIHLSCHFYDDEDKHH